MKTKYHHLPTKDLGLPGSHAFPIQGIMHGFFFHVFSLTKKKKSLSCHWVHVSGPAPHSLQMPVHVGSIFLQNRIW